MRDYCRYLFISLAGNKRFGSRNMSIQNMHINKSMSIEHIRNDIAIYWVEVVPRCVRRNIARGDTINDQLASPR